MNRFRVEKRGGDAFAVIPLRRFRPVIVPPRATDCKPVSIKFRPEQGRRIKHRTPQASRLRTYCRVGVSISVSTCLCLAGTGQIHTHCGHKSAQVCGLPRRFPCSASYTTLCLCTPLILRLHCSNFAQFADEVRGDTIGTSVVRSKLGSNTVSSSNSTQTSRLIPLIVIALGIVIMVGALLADSIGISGGGDGLGWKQLIGLIVGLVIAVSGAGMLLRKMN